MQQRRWWISAVIAVLFPKVCVAVIMQRGNAMTAQFWLGVKSWGLGGIVYLATGTAESRSR